MIKFVKIIKGRFNESSNKLSIAIVGKGKLGVLKIRYKERDMREY